LRRAGMGVNVRRVERLGSPVAATRYAALTDWLPEASQSAKKVAPILVELFSPTSVVDFGCGLGAWLHAFADEGVGEILGVDGSWVDPDDLVIPPDVFRVADLASTVTLERRYDMAISLEVGEHLPPASAEALVYTLTEAAPIVVFSAAAPGQGGVEHLNEQPPIYWATKFEARGYSAHDVLRPLTWEMNEVAYYYRQNVVIYLGEEARAAFPQIPATQPLEIVHPSVLHRPTTPITVGALLRELPHAVIRSLRWRIRRLLDD
jgi:SAM-dependent methyltransferase